MVQLEPPQVREKESASSLTVLRIFILGHQPTNNKTCRGGPVDLRELQNKEIFRGLLQSPTGLSFEMYLQISCMSAKPKTTTKTLQEKNGKEHE